MENIILPRKGTSVHDSGRLNGRAAWGVLLTVIVLSGVAGAADPGLLKVKGRGVGEGKPYRGGGTVRFLDARIDADLVHYEGGESLTLPLVLEYDVLEAAPVVLTSRLGTEYWKLYSFSDDELFALHTDERIYLSEPGRHTARATTGTAAGRYGSLPSKGLVGIQGHYYFLIEPADGGQWLDVTDPPPFFSTREVRRRCIFTMADLSHYQISVERFQSSWQEGGLLRLRLTVTDADGESFPVVSVPLTVSAGDRQAELETQLSPIGAPTGWLTARLPQDDVPPEVAVSGTVKVVTPDGPETRKISARFERGHGRVSAEEMKLAEQGYRLPRDEGGMVRETRAMWVAPDGFESRENVDKLVARAAKARLNVLIPDIFVRSRFQARSDLMPDSMQAGDDFDPLAYLIEKAHKAGLEVHPWFCVTYRDARFRKWFEGEHGVNVDVVGSKGEVEDLPADVHRDAYRDFIVDLMVGVARDYDVDGIHLDYIRAMAKCHCDHCRREFADRFGKPLSDATDEDWIEWQRSAIGDIVRRTAEGVRDVRSDAIMSAAVFSNMGGGAMQGQDPAGWARKGWLDVVIPMDYAMETLAVRANERQFLKALADDDKLTTGLSIYMRTGGKAVPRHADLVSEQVQLVRQMGIHGYCLFCDQYLSDEIIDKLRTDLNAEKAKPFFR